MPKYQHSDPTVEIVKLSTLDEDKCIQLVPYGHEVVLNTEMYVLIKNLILYTDIRLVHKKNGLYYVFVDATEQEILYIGGCFWCYKITVDIGTLKSIVKKSFINDEGTKRIWSSTFIVAYNNDDKDSITALMKVKGMNDVFPTMDYRAVDIP